MIPSVVIGLPETGGEVRHVVKTFRAVPEEVGIPAHLVGRVGIVNRRALTTFAVTTWCGQHVESDEIEYVRRWTTHEMDCEACVIAGELSRG